MTNACLLYYATAIKANKFRYSTCGREANRTFRSLLIPDIAEIPAWINKTDVDMYDGAEIPSIPTLPSELQMDCWQSFELQTLFEIKKGKRLTKANQSEGNTPYIGAIDKNNGVSSCIGQKAIHKDGTISVSYNGSVAEAFYQPVPFWATDDVNVLYPKFNLTPAIALFITTLIRQEKYRFNYGRKWHMERMKESCIRLPVKTDSTPDWDFMEQYIKSLPYSSQID